MLKIKDNVPLEKLKEYGFKEFKNEYKRVRYIINFVDSPLDIKTSIHKTDKTIHNMITKGIATFFDDNEGIEDFIQSGLVEKVSD